MRRSILASLIVTTILSLGAVGRTANTESRISSSILSDARQQAFYQHSVGRFACHLLQET
jgi:Tfp pilus assembly protein PilX